MATKNQPIKFKRIFNRNIDYELRNLGCEIYKVQPNRNKPEFDVYLFYDTPKLQESLRILNNQ